MHDPDDDEEPHCPDDDWPDDDGDEWNRDDDAFYGLDEDDRYDPRDEDDDLIVFRELTARQKERSRRLLREQLRSMRKMRLKHLQRIKKDPVYRLESTMPF